MGASRPEPSDERASAASAPRCLTHASPRRAAVDDVAGRATAGVGDEADTAGVTFGTHQGASSQAGGTRRRAGQEDEPGGRGTADVNPEDRRVKPESRRARQGARRGVVAAAWVGRGFYPTVTLATEGKIASCVTGSRFATPSWAATALSWAR